MPALPVLSDGLALLIPAALVGWSAAWLGRKLGLPGFAAALAAGLLLGPGVLGRTAPDLHRNFFTGGAVEQRELVQRESYYESQLASLQATGVTEAAITEYQQKVEAELEPYRQAVIEAQSRRAEARELMTWTIVGLTLLGLGARMRVGRLFPAMRDAMPLAMYMILFVAVLSAAGATLLSRMQEGAEANLWFAGLMLGGMSMAVPASRRLMEAMRGENEPQKLDDRPQLLDAAGLIVMLTVWVVFTLVRPTDIEATQTEVMVTHVRDALMAGVLIVAALFMAHPWLKAVAAQRPHGMDVTLAATGLVIAGVGYFVLELHPVLLAWLIGLTLGVRPDGEASVSNRLVDLAGPVAMVMVGWQVDLVGGFHLWLALAVLIIFGDGKALGMLLGFRWFTGRTWTAALGIGVAAGAGGELAVLLGFVLYESRVIDEPLLVALITANVICGVTARWMMKWLRNLA